MRFYKFLCIICFQLNLIGYAQIGIGTTNPRAVLDIHSATSGILMPRLTTKERLAIENPAQALTIYDLDLGCFTFWHNNQWHCLCGENDVLSPEEDIDDDDDGIRDTDEIANCIANGEDVIFTVTDVPDNYTEQYYTVKGNYYTNCGVGTWSFEKPKLIPGYGTNEINFTYFANKIDGDDSKPVGVIKDNKQVYFNFNTTRSDEFKLYGIFTFNGPPIIPIIEG